MTTIINKPAEIKFKLKFGKFILSQGSLREITLFYPIIRKKRDFFVRNEKKRFFCCF